MGRCKRMADGRRLMAKALSGWGPRSHLVHQLFTNEAEAMTYWFELHQGGEVVATVEAADKADALREIWHYAAVYAQDGKVEIIGKNKQSRAALFEGATTKPESI